MCAGSTSLEQRLIDAFLQENDRFVFTAAVLEGRDPRVEAAIKERIEEIAESRRASLSVIQSAENADCNRENKKYQYMSSLLLILARTEL